MPNELKPCPFCGCEAATEEDSMGWTRAFCPLCGIATTKYRVAPQYARELWNRRDGEVKQTEAQGDLEMVKESRHNFRLEGLALNALVRIVIRLAEKEE